MAVKIYIQKFEEPFLMQGFTIDEILSLIQIAYKERIKDGIRFETVDFTVDNYRFALSQSNNVFFCAIENKKLYGVARLKNHYELCNFAVLPEAQGKHIGSLLLQALINYGESVGLDHIYSYTSTKAHSSVRCHLNNGFNIISVIRDNGYWSYLFRCQLKKHWFWSNKMCCKLRFVLCYVWKHVRFLLK